MSILSPGEKEIWKHDAGTEKITKMDYWNVLCKKNCAATLNVHVETISTHIKEL